MKIWPSYTPSSPPPPKNYLKNGHKAIVLFHTFDWNLYFPYYEIWGDLEPNRLTLLPQLNSEKTGIFDNKK